MGNGLKTVSVKTAIVALAILLITSAAVVACQGETPNATTQITSGKSPNASVSGTVTYRERLALTPGARLQVQLRDTSYQDAPSPLIAEQIIENPGRVPIKFKVEYNRDDIDDRNVYSIQAKIIESDGRLVFISDTAYHVITRGNPRKLDVELMLVNPYPRTDRSAGDEEPVDLTNWVEAEYPIVGAMVLPPHEGDFLQVSFLQSDLENCSRRREQSLDIDGNNIRVTLTHMVPPPAPWAAPCDDYLRGLDEIIDLNAAIAAGETYHLFVNSHLTQVFRRPHRYFPDSVSAWPDVVEAELQILESDPPQYNLLVTYGIPAGSGCSQEDGFSIFRSLKGLHDGIHIDGIHILLTYHKVAPAEEPIICTADYPIKEITIPLGSEFEAGREYTVTIKGEEVATFTAQ